MIEKEIYVNRLRTNYKIAGSGPAILILHGWGGSSDSWMAVQKILSKNGFTVICPDLPGFGKSLTPLSAWGVGEYMRWVANFVDALRLERFVLLGHSFGGRIAIKFASDYSDRLNDLILCDSAGIRPELNLKARLVFSLAMIGNTILSPRHLVRLKNAVRNFFYVFLRHHDYVKAKGVMRDIMKKVITEDLLSILPKIKTKTLLIWGEKDRLVPIKYAYIFREKVANSELKIIPKVGHSPNLEAPQELSNLILNFIK